MHHMVYHWTRNLMLISKMHNYTHISSISEVVGKKTGKKHPFFKPRSGKRKKTVVFANKLRTTQKMGIKLCIFEISIKFRVLWYMVMKNSITGLIFNLYVRNNLLLRTIKIN